MTGSAPGNRPERLQWFNGLGFGMFIHWSIERQAWAGTAPGTW